MRVVIQLRLKTRASQCGEHFIGPPTSFFMMSLHSIDTSLLRRVDQTPPIFLEGAGETNCTLVLGEVLTTLGVTGLER